MTMTRYRAFDLVVASELPLPGLAATGSGKADIVVRLGEPVADLAMPEGSLTSFQVSGDDATLAWRGIGRVRISDAAEIVVEPCVGGDPVLLGLLLLGPVFGLLLHQRGALVLHGSAVRVGDRAVIFLGDKGAGKSTTAASLIARGHRLVTDDIAAIRFDGAGQPWMAPGIGQLKLYAAAASTVLGDAGDELPPVGPGMAKRARDVGAAFAEAAIRPARIYMIEKGPEAAVSPMPMSDACLGLIRHSYIGRFGVQALAGPRGPGHLAECAALVRAVPTRRLDVPPTFDRFEDVARLVEREMEA